MDDADDAGRGKKPRPADLLEDLAARLLAARQEIDRNRTRFARRYGVAHTLWAKWERGENYPDPYVMARMCADYGLTMDFLYRGVLMHMPNEELKLRLARVLPGHLLVSAGMAAPAGTGSMAPASSPPVSAGNTAASRTLGTARAKERNV